MSVKLTAKQRRAFRTRNKLRRVNVMRSGLKVARPWVSVNRTNKQIYVQLVDDIKGITLASASSLDKELKLKNGGNAEAAQKVGKLLAQRATKAGVKQIQFDRGSYIYHGRVKALAEGAREGGLEF